MHRVTHEIERAATAATQRRRKTVQQFLQRSVPRLLVQFPQAKKIILFGSYASGHPRFDSDIDLLVVTPTRRRWNDRVRMAQALFRERPAPLDIIVRTPREIRQRLTSYFCPFTREILQKGRVLYEAPPRRS